MTSHPDEDLPVVYFQDGTYGETPSCISPQILAALTAYFGGPFKFFAMQSAVISHIVHFAVNVKRVGDVVVRSPTGSGKTLAFAIPIVERLLRRAVPRLRAVIVVPTHDLATQVAAVFSALTKGTDITVALATGAVTVASEADAAAAAEVLIATPGRLIDHVENTPGVTLAHVEFLVLDESDRLLQDAYYSWADIVLPRCGIPQPAEDGEEGEVALPCSGILAMAIPATVRPRPGFGGRVSLTRKILVSATATRDPQRLAKLKLQRVTYFEPVSSKAVTSEKGETDESPKDGEGEKQYSVPHKLDECAFVLPSSRHKPMALLSILGWNTGVQPTEKNSASSIQSVSKLGSKLVFTKSVESAHRLARLLELFSRQQETEPIVLEISRDVSPKRRSAVLALLKESENASESKPKRPVIVVCSDVFARGMDIPSVEAVISYDAAVQVRTYLHRVGRTARAGRPGIAVTILLAKQVRHFKSMVRDVDRGKKKCKIRDVHIDGLRDSQQAALLSRRLSALKRVLRRESLGLLKTGECLPGHLLVEMSTDDATVLKQHAARKRARTATDVGFNSAKRARVDSGMNGEEHEGNEDVRVQDTAERRWREDEDGENGAGEDDDDASSIGGDSDLGEDSFQDILRAYVASNWLSERSKV